MYQNIDIIESYAPRFIVLLAGDHIYKMDYEPMLQQHVEQGADVTVGCIEVPRMEATGFGVMAVDAQDRIISFLEKPADPPGMPGEPGPGAGQHGHLRVRDAVPVRRSCGATPPTRTPATISARTSSRTSSRDGKRGGAPLRRAPACARSAETRAYWRDVGTVDAYWEANIDLTDFVPGLDLYDRNWPIWTYGEIVPPAKFIHDEDGRRGQAISSLVSGGCIVSGSHGPPLAAVHRRAHAFLRHDRGARWCCPMREIGRARAADATW